MALYSNEQVYKMLHRTFTILQSSPRFSIILPNYFSYGTPSRLILSDVFDHSLDRYRSSNISSVTKSLIAKCRLVAIRGWNMDHSRLPYDGDNVNNASSLFTQLYMIPNRGHSNCINLNRNIGTTGKVYKFRDFRDEVDRNRRNVDYTIVDIFTIGSDDIIFACLDRYFNIIFDFDTIKRILSKYKTNEYDILIDLISKVLVHYKLLIRKCDDIKSFDYDRYITDKFTSSTLNNDFVISLDDGSISNRIVNDVLHSVRRYTKSTIYGITSRQSYSKLVDSVIDKMKQDSSQDLDQAFNSGLTISSKMNQHGWVFDRELSSTYSDIRFSKDVDIVPTTFWREKKKYVMTEDQTDRFKRIKKISISMKSSKGVYVVFESSSKRLHPNVSENWKVCLGSIGDFDLADDFPATILGEIEILLTSINFDSPFRDRELSEKFIKEEGCLLIPELLDNVVSNIEGSNTLVSFDDFLQENEVDINNIHLLPDSIRNVTNDDIIVTDEELSILDTTESVTMTSVPEMVVDTNIYQLASDDLSLTLEDII